MPPARPSPPTSSPAAEHELILRLCGTAAARQAGAERIAALAEASGPERFAAAAQSYHMLPLLVTRLSSALPEAVPPALRHVAEREAEQWRHIGALQQAVTGRVVSRLSADGIPALPLKGPSLAEKAYGDLGLRRSSDIDLLVASEQLEPALRALRDCGYGEHDDEPWDDGLPILHYTLPPRTAWLPELELHWRIHWYETGFSQRLLAHSSTAADGQPRSRADYELAAMLLFFQRDSFGGLRHATDVAALWDASRDELPPHALDPLLDEHPELQEALLAAVAAAERLVGVPADALVSPRWHLSRRADAAVRLANPTLTDAADAAADMVAVDWLLTPRGQRVAFLRRYFFQPPATMARTYGFDENARLRGRAHQLVRGSARLARFLVGYARARRRSGARAPALREAV